MIDEKELEFYIQQISKTKITEENYKDFFDYSIKVCKDYDKKPRDGTNNKMLMNELCYIFIFFHKLCNNLYGLNTKCEFKVNGTNHYTVDTNSIAYRFGSGHDLMSNSSYHIFTIFHENRHAMQYNQFLKNDDILTMDPSAIVMAKEIISMNYNTYKNNHSSYMIENDANLYAYSFISNIIKTYFPENISTIDSRMRGENYNIAQDLFNGFINSEEVYPNVSEETLPILYQIDQDFKQKVTPELISKYKVLSLIYNKDGTKKSYEQIKQEKLDKIVNLKNPQNHMKFPKSSQVYKEEIISTPIERIELIYNTIINSDPALYIENCIANNKFNELINEINKYPKIYEIYKKDFHSIISRYINFNNKQEIDKISKIINSEELNDRINKKYNYIIKKEIKNITGVVFSLEDENGNIKDENTLLQEYEYFKTIIKNKKENKQLDDKVYNIIISYLEDIYNANRINLSNSNTNEYDEMLSQLNNQPINSPNHEEKREKIDDIPEYFKTTYNNIFFSYYRKHYEYTNNYKNMSEDEKEEFDYTFETERKKQEQNLDDNFIQERSKSWEIIKQLLLANPNLDLESTIRQVAFSEFEKIEYNEEIDNKEIVEQVEKSEGSKIR